MKNCTDFRLYRIPAKLSPFPVPRIYKPKLGLDKLPIKRLILIIWSKVGYSRAAWIFLSRVSQVFSLSSFGPACLESHIFI